MAGDVSIPNEVMDALIENTKAIDANTELITKITSEKDTKTKNEKNLVQKPVVSSSLTSDEKARYGNIGKELFAPVLTSLEKLLKKEKKRNEMIIKDDAQTVENSVKVQYETKENEEANQEGGNWLTTILTILAVAGVAVALFHDKIIEFFSGAWDWIKEMFSSIGNFFSFDNGENPINKILNTCGTALGGLWEFVKKAFKKMGEFGSIIWEGIKSGWDKFITGPDGILNFGVKIVKGIIAFASNAISWIGEAISSSVIGPIKTIFSGAEKDGKDAGREAAKDVKATANQAVADQAAKTKAVTGEVMFSAEKADAAIIETAKATREDARKRAKEQGLELDKNGKVTDESLKEAAAKAGLDAFLKANKLTMADTDGKYDAIKEEFMKHVEISNGKAEIKMEKLREALKTKADGEAKLLAPDGKFINALQSLSKKDGAEKMNQMNGAVNAALQKGLDITADMKAAQNLENMTEDERFEARLRQAMNQGASAEFRFIEGRKMILQATETIKSSFRGYDENIRESFTGTWRAFMDDFLNNLKIEIETVSPQDNSVNTYHIMPLEKKSFGEMSNKMLKLAQENTAILAQQNKVLDKIKGLLLEPPPQKILIESALGNKIQEEIDEGVNFVAQMAQNLTKDILSAVGF